MDNALATQLALYPALTLPPDQTLHWVADEAAQSLVLQTATAPLRQWPAPLRWGEVLDYLSNQPTIIASIQLTPICVFDPQRSLLQCGAETTRLTDKEQATLLYLYQAARPVPRDELVDKVWGYHAAVQTHTVETLIWRLRQKLEPNPEAPVLLVTTSQGYQLSAAH